MKKCTFVAPRFHTNQLELVRYIQEKGVETKFLVAGRGVSEKYSYLQPEEIEFSSIFSLVRKRISTKGPDFIFDYKWGIPSLKELKKYLKENPEFVIIRSPYSVVSMFFATLSKFMGTKIVFYTQRPVHKHPDHLKDAGVKLILKVFGADWISPCLGDVRYDKVSRNFRYVPFCIKSVVYKKKWFRDGFVNIVSVGKFVERKNHHLLIRALTPLASESKIRLTIIGELSDVTGEDYYQKVMDMISSAPFEVQVENNLDQNEVFDIYKRNDLFVLASANEPASVSNLEAMSFGLPVVTSDTNQTSCYTQGNGAVFASGSVEDLTKKLSELISDRSKMVEMGRLSRSLVEKNHNSETVYADFLQNVSR